MNKLHRVAVFAAITALSALSGCIVAPGDGHYRDHDRYRYENGDRIDRDGHRDHHWCDGHHDDDHCR